MGDAFFMGEIFRNTAKPFVYKLLWPYVVFFSLASACSLLSVAIKSMLFYQKLRQRVRRGSKDWQRRSSLGGVSVAPELLFSPRGQSKFLGMKELFEMNRLEKYASLLSVLQLTCEDVPLGLMNLLYFTATIGECIDGFGAYRIAAQGKVSTSFGVCDTDKSAMTLMLLTTMTSAMMLGFKAVCLDQLRVNIATKTALDDLRARFVAAPRTDGPVRDGPCVPSCIGAYRVARRIVCPRYRHCACARACAPTSTRNRLSFCLLCVCSSSSFLLSTQPAPLIRPRPAGVLLSMLLAQRCVVHL